MFDHGDLQFLVNQASEGGKVNRFQYIVPVGVSITIVVTEEIVLSTFRATGNFEGLIYR